MIATYKGHSKSGSVNSLQSASVPFFDCLPDDVIVRIFSRLPAESLCACARVCRRFYFLVSML